MSSEIRSSSRRPALSGRLAIASVCAVCFVVSGLHWATRLTAWSFTGLTIRHSHTNVAIRHPSGLPKALRTVRLAEAKADEDGEEEEFDLESDPLWQKTKKDVRHCWNIRHYDDDWLHMDNVLLLLQEHFRATIGAEGYEALLAVVEEAAAQEPNVDKIYIDDFVDIAGAFVYRRLFM
eukprot:TRINITY_DN13063_c0_g6_i2.p1 TRINITY_DN13063_c0_g6~~TRINITY_DN13063_c0_g6_i2.p1  ORF type:complete len:178 (+),score=23.23 TRINITY_DN13063_c0_g6_i2:82-615(+)